jgi:hypothetical protein
MMPVDMTREGPGRLRVGPFGVVTMTVYLAALATLLVVVLVAIWPTPTPNLSAPENGGLALAQDYWACSPAMQRRWAQDATVRDPKCVSIVGGDYLIWDEQRLLLIVLVCGALGALLHALRSLAMYIGNRELRRSWLVMYALLPFTGGILALVFYVIIRGGFFAPNTTVDVTSPFSFAAMSVMVGLFSQHALEKLKQVAESFFTRTEPAKDSLATTASMAVISSAARVAAEPGGPQDTIEITGSGFDADTMLDVNGRERTPELIGPNRLRLLLDTTELAVLENGGELRVGVRDGDGVVSVS